MVQRVLHVLFYFDLLLLWHSGDVLCFVLYTGADDLAVEKKGH